VDAVARWLHLPTRSEAQARAAAKLLLQDEQALADEVLHLALGTLEEDGHRLVVAVSQSRMDAWRAWALERGLAPLGIIPDHLLVTEPAEGRTVAVRLGAELVVRGRRLAFACEPELAPILLDGRDPEVVDDPAGAERLFAEGAADPTINLLQGALAPRGGGELTRKRLLRPALLLAALVLSPLAIDAVQAVRLNLAADRLERESAAELAKVLPKGAAINDPAAHATARLQRLELASGGGPVGSAAQLFAALAEIEGAQIETLLVSPDGAVSATLSHANYSDLELLKGAMRRAGLVFRETATREEAGRILSDVVVGGAS